MTWGRRKEFILLFTITALGFLVGTCQIEREGARHGDGASDSAPVASPGRPVW